MRTIWILTRTEKLILLTGMALVAGGTVWTISIFG
jgi:hypothetical protein